MWLKKIFTPQALPLFTGLAHSRFGHTVILVPHAVGLTTGIAAGRRGGLPNGAASFKGRVPPQ